MVPSPRLLTRRVLLQTGTGLAATLAGGLGAQAAAQEDRPGATPAASPAATGRVPPERVVLAAERVPMLARQILAQTGVPGMSVAVVYGDAVAFLGGFGVRQLGGDAVVDADTVFQLASVSKSIAATVVAAVVGDGTVEWTSRMADVDPGFALWDAWPTQQVTLTDLFAHRSGLRDHAGDLLEDLGFDRDDVIHRLRYLEPEYSFRAGYAYTNFGVTAAAVAVAKAAGASWEDLSAARLYAPLGMVHTSSRFADYMAEANRAIPHVKDGEGWKVTPMQRDPDAQSPAGGVSSTARDLVPWVRLQLGQGVVGGPRLIPAAALAPAHVPLDPVEPLGGVCVWRGDGVLPAAGGGVRRAGAHQRRPGRCPGGPLPQRTRPGPEGGGHARLVGDGGASVRRHGSAALRHRNRLGHAAIRSDAGVARQRLPRDLPQRLLRGCRGGASRG
jgi:CubicO group peptidase (beta-lactamase class C family)